MCCYHMFCFTDFVEDPTVRFKIGLCLMLFTSLNLAVNCSIMAIETLFKLFRTAKGYYQKYRIFKYVEQIKQR